MPRITKKQIAEENQKELRLQKNTIACIGMIMQKLELNVDKYGYIQRFDEEGGEYTSLTFDGRRCKSTLIPNIMIDPDTELAFDPYNNIKLAISLLTFYIAEFIGKEILVMGPTNKKLNERGKLILKLITPAGTEITEGHEYFRDSLKYIDMIYVLDGSAPPEFTSITELDTE